MADRWDQPRRTGNSAIVAGYICGALHKLDDPLIHTVEIGDDEGPLISDDFGNVYRLEVVQIEGVE